MDPWIRGPFRAGTRHVQPQQRIWVRQSCVEPEVHRRRSGSDRHGGGTRLPLDPLPTCAASAGSRASEAAASGTSIRTSRSGPACGSSGCWRGCSAGEDVAPDEDVVPAGCRDLAPTRRRTPARAVPKVESPSSASRVRKISSSIRACSSFKPSSRLARPPSWISSSATRTAIGAFRRTFRVISARSGFIRSRIRRSRSTFAKRSARSKRALNPPQQRAPGTGPCRALPLAGLLPLLDRAPQRRAPVPDSGTTRSIKPMRAASACFDRLTGQNEPAGQRDSDAPARSSGFLRTPDRSRCRSRERPSDPFSVAMI